jgi:lipopolysaccharide/colanic/teichoic acid biosynthesis glycosyltransferase
MSLVPVSRANWVYNVDLYDVICVSAAPWMAFALRDPRFFGPPLIGQGAIYAAISLLSGVAILYWSGIGGIICRYFSPADYKRIVLAAFLSVAIASMLAFTVTRLNTIPRSLPVIQFFLFGFFLIVGRLVRAALTPEGQISRRKRPSRADENVVVVGANHIATFYLRLIDKCGLGYQRVLAVVDPDPRLRNQTLGGHRVIGTPEDLPAILCEYKTHGIEIHRLVVTLDESQLSESTLQCLRSDISASRHIDIEFLAERLGFTRRSNEVSRAQEIDATPEAQVNGPTDVLLCRHGYWKLKRIIDCLVAGSLLIILAPILAMTALMVRIGIGSPVIFWQRRVGRLGTGILVLKFRTMHPRFDANGHLRDVSGELCLIGEVLRRTRLDELPQLFNVLRGDMSLIGPRPLLPEDQPSKIGTRLLVPPGLTGWAQVNGGNLLSADEKTPLDEYYIRNASLWLDAKILFKTALVAFTGDRLPKERDRAAVKISRRLRRV